MIMLALFGVAFAFAVYRITQAGHYYVEYDGNAYWVWEKTFTGFNNCRGKFYSEKEALQKMLSLKENPPRIIS